MTINTQKLREAAQHVIDRFGSKWYGDDDWNDLEHERPPACDARHIAAASPTVVIGLLDVLDAQTAEIARLCNALRWLSAGFEAGRDNARRMFEESGNLYHEGRKVAYDQAAADARAALAQEGS